MQPIPLDTRRAILQQKLAGASNREVADQFDVSVGTVSNVLADARQGEFDATQSLEIQLDALLDLGKRLKKTDLDLAAAHLGLDVYEWLSELGLEPAAVERFKAQLDALADDERELQRYGAAVQELHELEETTGLELDGRLGELVTSLAQREPDAVERLAVVSNQTGTLTADIDALETAIDRAVSLLEFGFDLETAQRLAAELETVGDGDQQDRIETLAEVHAEYEHLRYAVEDLRATRESLEAECNQLRGRRDSLETEIKQFEERIRRVERALDAQQETLEELTASNADLREDIAHHRDRLDDIQSELEANEAELAAIQQEREVVHAYRRFLRDSELSPSLLSDLRNLLEIHDDTVSEWLDEFEPAIRERTIDGLRELAMEMLEGEEMIPVAEHERKLREKGRTEETLDELETERQAVAAFLEFLEAESIPEDLLDELLAIKRGRGHWLESTKERKTEAARQFLIEQLEAFTKGEEVIARSRHREILEEERERFEAELAGAFETIQQLAEQLRDLQTLLDEDWVDEVSRQIIEEGADEEAPVTVDEVQQAIEQTLEDEVQRRVDLELTQRGLVASSAGVGPGGIQGFDPLKEDNESRDDEN